MVAPDFCNAMSRKLADRHTINSGAFDTAQCCTHPWIPLNLFATNSRERNMRNPAPRPVPAGHDLHGTRDSAQPSHRSNALPCLLSHVQPFGGVSEICGEHSGPRDCDTETPPAFEAAFLQSHLLRETVKTSTQERDGMHFDATSTMINTAVSANVSAVLAFERPLLGHRLWVSEAVLG